MLSCKSGKLLIIALGVVGILLLKPKAAPAQTSGEPVFRQLTFYGISGGAIGAATGAVLWLTDPAGKNSHLGTNVITGFALGVLIGGAYGFYDVGSKLSDTQEAGAYALGYGKSRPREPAPLRPTAPNDLAVIPIALKLF